MKRLAVVVITTFISIFALAQASDVNKLIHTADSLKAAAPNSFEYVLALDAVAGHYFTNGDFKKALPFREECLKAIVQQRDESDNAVLLIKTYLADTYSNLERYEEAADLYLQCAGIYSKDAIPREDYFYVLNGLVVAYINLNDIPSAIQYRSQASHLVQQLSGTNDLYARQQWLLGELYALNEQHDIAIKCFDESKAILDNKREYQSDFYSQLLHDYLQSVLYYGDRLYNEGNYVEARVQRLKAIELSDILPDDLSYLRSLYRKSVGDIDMKLGDYSKAIVSYEEALELLSDEDMELQKEQYIQTLTQKAICLNFLQKYEEELPIISAVVELVKDKYGTFSFEYALDLDLLGQNQYYLEDYSSALNNYLESRKVFTRIRYPKNVYYEFIQQDIASAYNKLGKQDDAIKENGELIRYLQETYGPYSLQVITRQYTTGAFYEAKNDVINADKSYLNCWKLIEAGRHQNTTEAAEILDVVTQIFIREGDYDKAFSLRQQRAEIITNVFGNHSPEYAENLKLIGSLCFLEKDYTKAIDFFTQAIQLYDAIGAIQEPAYAQAMESLAYAKLALNDTHGSISDGIKAVEAVERKHGKNSLEYAQVLSNLGDAYYTAQMYPEALTSYEESYSIVLGKWKTEEYIYEHLLQSLPHAYIGVGDYDKGTQYFELYKDYLISKGRGKGLDFTSLLHDIASVSLQSTDLDRAVRLNKEYIAYLDNEGKKNEDYAIALSSIAYLYSIQGDLTNTTKYVDLSNSLFKDLNVEDGVYLSSNAAYMYAVTGDESYVKSAIDIIREISVSAEEKKNQMRGVYSFIATVDHNARRMDRAYQDYCKLQSLDETIYGQASKEYVTDLYMAALACEETNPDESLSRFLSAIKIIEESNVVDIDTYASILFWTGYNYQNRFDYPIAVDYYEKAAQLSKAANNYTLTQAILTNYGQTNTQLGNFAKAVSALEDKLQQARLGNGHEEDICQSLNELGRTHMAFGDYNQAITLIDQAREIAVSNDYSDYLLSTTLGLAECYENMQNYDLAARELTKIRNYRGSSTLQSMLPVLDMVAAMYYQRSGDKARAKKLIEGVEGSIATSITSDPKIDGATNFTMALYYLSSNEISKSRSFFNRAQDIYKGAFGESYNEYIRSIFLSGIVDMASNDPDSAIHKFDSARDLYSKYYTTNNPLAYTSYFFPIYARYALHRTVTTDMVRSFISFEKKQAEELFFQMTSNERSAFWKTHSNSKDLIFSVGVDNGDAEVLYDYSLFYKGVLLDSDTMLGDAILKSGDEDIISKYNLLLSLKEEAIKQSSNMKGNGIGSTLLLLNGAREQQEDIYSVINSLERELALYARDNLNLQPSSGLNYLDVSKSLKKNEVAVEFVDYERIAKQDEEDTREILYCALVLKPGGKAPLIIPLCSQKELSSCVIAGEKAYDPSNYISGELYKLIWSPLEKHIKKGNKVYFSPSGSLYQVAVESITTPKGKPLSELYTLCRLSSTKRICQSSPENEYSSSILYGGLQYDVDGELMISQSREYSQRSTSVNSTREVFRGESRSGWGYLPGTKAEIDALGDLFKQNEIQCTSFTGIYGNEESFKALSGTNTTIIHIATHGFYIKPGDVKRVSYYEAMLNDATSDTDDYDPMKRSGLILSGGNMAWQGHIASPDIEDGVLTAEEIANMHLENTDLVVLSACESGLGDLSSDGVMGIQRAFKNAGVQTLVMSLWKVDDEATRLLMTEFYKLLLAGETKRSAFDKAKEFLRKDSRYSNPHYWAAFIMLD